MPNVYCTGGPGSAAAIVFSCTKGIRIGGRGQMSERKGPNNIALFAVGIVFLGVGVGFTSATDTIGAGVGLLGMGVVFMVIGVKCRNKQPK